MSETNLQEYPHTFIFKDKEQIFFATGKIDAWCVYRQKPDGKRLAPRDTDYFQDLSLLANKYEPHLVYKFFLTIYEATDKKVQKSVLETIRQQALTLEQDDQLQYGKVMMTIYYAMVAEENRKPEYQFPLKKKVKKIGIHQILVLGMSSTEAANYSKGKKAKELKELLIKYEDSDRQNGITG